MLRLDSVHMQRLPRDALAHATSLTLLDLGDNSDLRPDARDVTFFITQMRQLRRLQIDAAALGAPDAVRLGRSAPWLAVELYVPS